VHQARMRRNPVYRRDYEIRSEVQRLESVPRYTVTSTNLLGGKFELVDSKSFLGQYKAIFEQQIYRFATRTETPRIIDGGAHGGLSVLYFKRSSPKGRVTAFEPDPDIFQVLSKNCAAFRLDDVQLLPKALWTEVGTVPFDREGADAGRVLAEGHSLHTVDVPACRLKDYLHEEVDLLKLDLEGAELAVLTDCADALGKVRNVAIKSHPSKHQPQQLHPLTGLLHDARFRLHVTAGLTSSQPLWFRQVHQSMDMRLYIYGFRPGAASAPRP